MDAAASNFVTLSFSCDGSTPPLNFFNTLRQQNISINAPCGGNGLCGKCKARIVSGTCAPSETDRRFFNDAQLANGWRLLCKARPSTDITVQVPMLKEGGLNALTYFKPVSFVINPARQEEAYGIAADIGTTTITMALVNMKTGGLEASYAVANKQRELGADVISRIQHAAANGPGLLSQMVRQQISDGADALLQGRDKRALIGVAVAGNTAMLHLLMCLSCDTLGVYPFKPVTLDPVSLPYAELFSDGVNCNVDILPGISAFVGADITAGILFADMQKSQKPQLLLDIGTNGEMVVTKNGEIFCTSTAAGPAFEGGNISCGMGSVPGAICSVEYKDGAFSVDTIGGVKPVGLCGSGVLDAAYAAYSGGLIDKTGRLKTTELVLAKDPDGNEIKFTQKDIRQLQLAKSAIRSGIDSLLSFAGLKADDIETLYIAGGFGFHINFESGVGIGLIPQALKNKICLIGNSALGGAVKYLLDADSGSRLEKICKCAKEFNLAEDALFNNSFVGNINFI